MRVFSAREVPLRLEPTSAGGGRASPRSRSVKDGRSDAAGPLDGPEPIIRNFTAIDFEDVGFLGRFWWVHFSLDMSVGETS